MVGIMINDRLAQSQSHVTPQAFDFLILSYALFHYHQDSTQHRARDGRDNISHKEVCEMDGELVHSRHENNIAQARCFVSLLHV